MASGGKCVIMVHRIITACRGFPLSGCHQHSSVWPRDRVLLTSRHRQRLAVGKVVGIRLGIRIGHHSATMNFMLLITLLLQAAQPCLAFVRPSSSLCPAPSSSSTQLSPLRAVAKVEKTDEEWRQVLSPEAYQVLREEGTEPPNTSPLNDVKEDGVFRCAGCGSPLFVTKTKYESGSGWPSFYAPIDGDAVELDVDFKLIAPRTEVHCKACGGLWDMSLTMVLNRPARDIA